MHTVCDVRNLELRSGLTPKQIWDSYKRDLNTALDRVDETRSLNSHFGHHNEVYQADRNH